MSVLRRDTEMDPLLKDLRDKKKSFRQNVVSLAVELKDVRHRLADHEKSVAYETATRQEAEAKAKNIEEEMKILQRTLEEREGMLQASSSIANEAVICSAACEPPIYVILILEKKKKHLKELDDLRSQISNAQATADASATSAESAQLQCLALVKELDNKNNSLKEHEVRVNKLGEQLDLLQKDLQAREFYQKQLKDDVLRVEHDIMLALSKSGANKDCELMKILDEVSPKNIEKIDRLLTLKDEEISKLRDEIRIMSAHWKIKTKELESQLEKHKRSDQELKKRVLKLEFCLQEARAQTRKLQRMGEKRDKAIKELRDQLDAKRPNGDTNSEKQFWEGSGFKFMASMSMLVLILFSKR